MANINRLCKIAIVALILLGVFFAVEIDNNFKLSNWILQ